MFMKVLSFCAYIPDCIVVLQGSKPVLEFFSFFPNCPVIATDGAANDLLGLGITPNVVIGDMDSFDPSVVDLGFCTLIRDENQENNDFEKAMLFALNRGYSTIVIWGMHGGDFEHSLNNTSILWKFSRSFSQITIVDSMSRIAVPVFFDMACGECREQEIISLIPFPYATITTQGLRWDLQEEVLELSVREGARNRALGSNVSLFLKEGRLLFFCESRFPHIPLFTEKPPHILKG
ncbi:MAG: thiamine diphosphokinase [Ignavibacteria bacterium]|nr:thiamine diphosphokinase [Ignavibacteria bacterium]